MRKHSVLRAILVLVLAILGPACPGGGGGGGPLVPDFVVDNLTGLGGFQMSAQGGGGGSGPGGKGGAILISAQTGSDLKVRTGSLGVDTATGVAPFFSASTPLDFGANVLDITTDTTITPDASGNGAITAGGNRATGIHVHGGATLTINPNGGLGVSGQATITLPGMVVLESGGGIQMPASGSGSGATTFLGLTCGGFWMAPGSNLSAAGTNPAGPTGGNIEIDTGGVIQIEGSIVATGADDFSGTTDAGWGGTVTLSPQAGAFLASTGSIITDGGRSLGGLTGDGGFGGSITIGTSFTLGDVILQGNLSANGGDSGNSNAVAGGAGNISVGDAPGPLGQGGCHGALIFGPKVVGGVNPSLSARGGTGSGSDTGGGPGGNVVFNVQNSVRLSADLDTRGGAGHGLSDGKSGGSIQILSGFGFGYVSQPTNAQGSAVTGRFWTDGGAAGLMANGGDAGNITISSTSNNRQGGLNPLNVVGYGNGVVPGFDTDGGSSVFTAGAGGNISIVQLLQKDATGAVFLQGSVSNDVGLSAKGGKGLLSGTGGAGGLVVIATQTTDTIPLLFSNFPKVLDSIPLAQAQGGALTRSAMNSAMIDTSGGLGAGPGNGGAAGEVWVADYYSALNGGAVTLSGGGSGAAGGGGGTGGNLWVASNLAATNQGDVTASGGDSTPGGGASGGGLWVWTLSPDSVATNTGNVTAHGGFGGLGGGAGGGLTMVGGNRAVNSGNVAAHGGSTGGYAGGGGGFIQVNSSGSDALAGSSNSGNLTAPGGDADQLGGNGGGITIKGHASASNSGIAVAPGGAATSGNGGNGGTVQVSADTAATSSNATPHILTGGGSTGGAGMHAGNGGALMVFGIKATHKGSVTAPGGVGTTDGGNGGQVSIFSYGGGSVLNGTMTLSAGAGGASAIPGDVWIDGAAQALTGGIRTF